MDNAYIQQISSVLNISSKQINQVIKMHVDGATVPFMARYRKEQTDNLDEVQILNIVEQYNLFEALIKRKETVLQTIEAAGKLDDALKQKIANCYNTTELEDIYLPYKPKRRTKATIAIEKGLEPLANIIYNLSIKNLTEEAAKYINNEVVNIEDALQGARDIIAEKIVEHEQARNSIRKLFEQTATITSKVLTTKKDAEEAQVFRDYFDFKQALSGIPSHRLLAIRRGEKEGFLLMSIDVDKDVAIEKLNYIIIQQHVNKANAQPDAVQQLSVALQDAYIRLLKNQIETEFRLDSKTKADEEAIKVFAENLKQLLLEAPLGQKNIMAIDPGFRTGCKIACINAQGNFLYYTTIYPHAPQNNFEESKKVIIDLVNKYNIEAIGYGNGTASRETEILLNSISFASAVQLFVVNESGASIYSASEVAREEFPNEDVTVRGAISIARRLLDPLSELVKIDAKSIGVGQYQHDVNQSRLKEMLDNVVISCVNLVGVDVNTASNHLLNYVSGISANLSKNIVKHRTEFGPFKTRDELKKVALMGPKTFEQCAGFLKIPNAINLLDNSSVHPERYQLVNQMANSLNTNLTSLVQNAELRKKIDPKKFVDESIGLYTIEDIIKELEKPGRDPRGVLETFSFDPNIKTIEDVKIGMQYPGIVTNITQFGAFVNIGVKQDGMVHISQMANKFISNPNDVVKLNMKVMVTAIEVDKQRNRIALSLKDATVTNSKPTYAPVKKENTEAKQDYAASLKALQSKFNIKRK
jgi:protein Tex